MAGRSDRRVLLMDAPQGEQRGLSWPKVGVLLLAIAFLAGAVGWFINDRQAAASRNAVDIGFSQDMISHHDQAVEMALILLAKPSIPAGIRSAAQEIIIFQRYEIGLLNDSLARWDEDVTPEGPAMGWMGEAVPRSNMPGLATSRQLDELRGANGTQAAAVFLALMTRHHQGGAAMAEAAAKSGRDSILRSLAASLARNQRIEIIEYESLRKRLDLPIPRGLEPLAEKPAGHGTMNMGGG